MTANLPNYTNFYCSFTSPTKQEIKFILEQCGWKSRKESWADFEFTNEWSELILSGNDGGPLLSGTLSDPHNNYKKLVGLLQGAHVTFLAELYDENKTLLYRDDAK